MKIYCTTCCKEKKAITGKIAAIDLYLDQRIHSIYLQSIKDGFDFRILSGKYGLLRATDLIPWYDKKMEKEDIAHLLPIIMKSIERDKIDSIILFAKDPDLFADWFPYVEVIRLACKGQGIDFEFREI